MRRRLPWLLALPVMAAGSVAAHSLSYLVVSARVAERGAEATERTSTGSASYLLLILGILAATAVVAAGRLLVRRRGRSNALNGCIWAVREASERASSGGPS